MSEDKVINVFEGDPRDQDDIQESTEKVKKIYTDLQSVETLKHLIKMIKEDRLRNFVVIGQSDNTEEEYLATGQKGHVAFYFYGKDSCITQIGLCNRMAHILQEYMDGNFVFSDEE
jgi:hypothetical protein